MALDVREGRELPYGDHGAAKVIGKGDVNQEMVLAADQVLVGTNRTRRRYNQRLRELKALLLITRRLATNWFACATILPRDFSTDRSGR